MKPAVLLALGAAIGAVMTASAFAIAKNVEAAQDPVQVSPQYYKVLLENDQVRVLEYRLEPGEKEAMHTHTTGVLYIFADANMRATYPDGRSVEITGGSGEAHWRDPVTHAMENTGDTEAHSLVVELKNPCKQD